MLEGQKKSNSHCEGNFMASCHVDFTADASDFKRAGDGLLKV
jgi:hypothetical protein